MAAKGEQAMRAAEPDPLIGADTRAEQAVPQETIDLESLPVIERQSLER